MPFMDPALPEFIQSAIESAFHRTGAPGRIYESWSDDSADTRGYFVAQKQYGIQRYSWRRNVTRATLTVVCNWSICGQRQRKQATVSLPR